MAYVVTYVASGVGETDATLNGIIDECEEPFYCWFEISGVGDYAAGYAFNEPISAYASGLSPSTYYVYRAKFFNGIAWVYGSWVGFTTQAESVPPPSPQARSTAGANTPTGVATKILQPPARSRLVAGACTPTGAAVGLLETHLDASAAGACTPTGVATGTVGSETEATGAGACTPSGGATAVLVNPEDRSATASCTPTGGAYYTVQNPLPSGGSCMAARFDLAFEQGASWSKVFVWKDSNGNGVNLANWTIRMTVKPFPGSATTIASTSSSIVVEYSATTGYFTLSILASLTALMDFVRAFYDIEAVSGTTIRKLLYGAVTMEKDV